jgi:hypothetical protein
MTWTAVNSGIMVVRTQQSNSSISGTQKASRWRKLAALSLGPASGTAIKRPFPAIAIPEFFSCLTRDYVAVRGAAISHSARVGMALLRCLCGK